MSEQASNQRIYSRIAGTGSYLPEKVLTNDDLAKIVDTSDEWITSRTGIRQRHVAAEGETTGDLAYHAAVRAMEAAGVEASEIDLIVLGRSEEHTSELQSLMRISYAVFCLKTKNKL